MSIPSINGFQPLTFGQTRSLQETSASPAAGPAGFADRIGAAMETLAKSQADATQAAADFETGKRSDLAAVMVEQQIASLGFQFALNVRNKALGAYRDIMNMPV